MIVRIGEAGFDISKTSIYWTYASGFPKASNIGKMVDKRLGNKRKVIGKEKIDIGIQSGSMHAGRKTEVIERDKTIGNSPLEGSYGGFQPKPAVEVIIVAMKPLSEKTYVDQAMKNKKGCTWLDDCRIPYEGEVPKGSGNPVIGKEKEAINPGRGGGNGGNVTSSQGRFPANLLVSDDVLNDGKNYQSGGRNIKTTCGDGFYKVNVNTQLPPRDSGSFSRYFNLDRWWAKTFPFLIVPKASKSEKNKGLEGLPTKIKQSMGDYGDQSKVEQSDGATRVGNKGESKAQNHHPTVKPIKLMSYLIMLTSREGDIVLDPFVGSGTTAVAAKQLKRDYIGIDLSQEYCDISEARLKNIQQTLL